MFSKGLAVGALSAVLWPMTAMAQIAELRVGVAEFDERTINFEGEAPFGRANENSVAISGEILFDEPEFLKWALSPQPYIGGSLNLEGNTSFNDNHYMAQPLFVRINLYAFLIRP